MSKLMQCFLGVAVFLQPAVFSSAQAGDAFSERIHFVHQDGRRALVYTTSRTDYEDYSIWFKEKDSYKPEDYLKDFLYLFPKSGEWSSNAKPGYTVLTLPTGNFASLEWANLEENGHLQVDEDGQYHYRNWDGETKTPDGHVGLWNSPGAFEQVAYTWVFPDNLEPVAHTSNREGEWIQRHNTITYYGNNVNDLVFDIHYRPASGDVYDDLKGLEGEGIEVEQEAGGVKITLAETLLFPSGVALISTEGKTLLDTLAEELRERSLLQVTVAGHTDNVPIGFRLQDKFPTNWELASARSLNIIHYLVALGVAEPRFESHSFSFMQPKASNDTVEGRTANRRIEIFLSETD
jgi:flagellar motor protein MotB